MIERILSKNRDIFLNYNRFRKSIFAELATADSDAILYLFPWLLCVNHPSCPGYLPDSTTRIKVFNIDRDTKIRNREPGFKKMFGIEGTNSLLKSGGKYLTIQGLYTIGSVGTVSQTSDSDCDIWVCYDRNEMDETAWHHLQRKINLIKDWMDQHLKMPVFFFLSDITDIRRGRFGGMDAESSGSAQKNALKEEFYRTCMIICGKIPLWCICYDPTIDIEYADAANAITSPRHGLDDVMDLGDLTAVAPSEYFGAALWQMHKSLSRPLKSIIKMTLLEMQLESDGRDLISHRLRSLLYSDETGSQDPMVFTMRAILEHYQQTGQMYEVEFLTHCFYLRCRLRPYDKRDALKRRLTQDLFKDYPINIKERLRLGRFDKWTFGEHMLLGDRLSQFLNRMYRDITSRHIGIASEISKTDAKVLGRKIIVAHYNRPDKIPVIQKLTGSLNLSSLVFTLEENNWNVYSGDDHSLLLISNPDVVFSIAFLVWNNLFDPLSLSMKPNPSSVSMQEIINLGKRMSRLFGAFNVSEIPFPMFLKKRAINRMLLVISFEKSPHEKDIHDFTLVYINTWGEFYVKRFQTTRKMLSFLRKALVEPGHPEPDLYIQRRSTSYQKIIERTKRLISTLPWITHPYPDVD